MEKISQLITNSIISDSTAPTLPWPLKSDAPLHIGTAENPTTLFLNSHNAFGNFTGITDSNGNPSISFNVSRGTLVAKESVHTNDRALDLRGFGFSNSEYKFLGGISIGVDPSGCVTNDVLPGLFNVVTVSDDFSFNNLVFDHRGQLHSPIFRITKSFDSITDRDTQLPCPAKGTIIFLDRDENGEARFQGFTGKQWSNLNV
jgi:hypothetical protein